MAELILTEKEKADLSFLDWDDAALGKLVKKTAVEMQDTFGRDGTFVVSAAHLLIGMAEQTNGDTLTFTAEGFSVGGEPKGDWRVTVEKIAEHSLIPCAERLPGLTDTDSNGDVVWLRSGVEMLGKAEPKPVDATHWKPTGVTSPMDDCCCGETEQSWRICPQHKNTESKV